MYFSDMYYDFSCFISMCVLDTTCIYIVASFVNETYEGRAKSSVTNRLPWFYPRYILKCFTALE